MSRTLLVTTSDDRYGRKGGLYGATQRKMTALLGDFIEQRHYTIGELMGCDELMENKDPAKNGRVYKPWAIMQELLGLEYGDFLIYNDCSPEMWPDGIGLSNYNLDVIRDLTRRNRDFLVGFVKWSYQPIGLGGLGMHTHHWFTLDSCLECMSAETYRDSFLCASGMICIRKTPYTMSLVERWLFFNRIKECSCLNVSDFENNYWDGVPGYKLGNRHDQSVLSVVLNQQNYDYCDIAYNWLNPYNFLNYCLPGHEYKFINSNSKGNQ